MELTTEGIGSYDVFPLPIGISGRLSSFRRRRKWLSLSWPDPTLFEPPVPDLSYPQPHEI